MILDRANALTSEAVTLDQSGELDAAIDRYKDAVQLLVLVAQRTPRSVVIIYYCYKLYIYSFWCPLVP